MQSNITDLENNRVNLETFISDLKHKIVDHEQKIDLVQNEFDYNTKQ